MEGRGHHKEDMVAEEKSGGTMTITDIVGAFSANSPAAIKNLAQYLRETEQADPAAPLPENVTEWGLWDELELLAMWYTGEGRAWEPRRPLKAWAKVHGTSKTERAVILVTLVLDLNIPSETAIPLDFYVPTEQIRQWTYNALQDVRAYTGNMEYLPDLPPTVKNLFQEWDQK